MACPSQNEASTGSSPEGSTFTSRDDAFTAVASLAASLTSRSECARRSGQHFLVSVTEVAQLVSALRSFPSDVNLVNFVCAAVVDLCFTRGGAFSLTAVYAGLAAALLACHAHDAAGPALQLACMLAVQCGERRITSFSSVGWPEAVMAAITSSTAEGVPSCNSPDLASMVYLLAQSVLFDESCQERLIGAGLIQVLSRISYSLVQSRCYHQDRLLPRFVPLPRCEPLFAEDCHVPGSA